MKPCKRGTPGLPDTKRLLGQLDNGSAQEFRPGDIVAARRNLQIGGQVVMSKGQRLIIERNAGGDSGEFYLTDGDAKMHRVSRGHLDFVRQGVRPRAGEIWVAASDILKIGGRGLVATKGQQLEIVASASDGNTQVVDSEGNHFWVSAMDLDPYVEDSQDPIAESSVAAKANQDEPAVLNAPRQIAPSEIYEHLRNLGKLQQEGILSEEEFQAKKAELLARL